MEEYKISDLLKNRCKLGKIGSCIYYALKKGNKAKQNKKKVNK